MTTAVVLWTNEVFHPRAWTYKEGYRHCMVFFLSSEGWYGREFRAGAGEIIYPRVADPDRDLLQMFLGNDPTLDEELSKRRTKAIQTEARELDQWLYCRYRKRSVCHVKFYLGIKNAAIKRPYHLYQFLSPAEKDPKKAKPVVAVTQHMLPVK